MSLKTTAIIILILVGLGFLLQQKFVQEPVLNFLGKNIPWSIPTLTFIRDNVVAGNLIGLLMFLVFVNIPFLPSPPAEAYAIFSLSKGTNIFGIIFVFMLVYAVFALVYYLLGRFWGQRMLEKILKRTIGHIPFLERFIGPIIFFAYLLPIPLPLPVASITVLLAGFYKAPISKVVAAVGMGTLFRVLLVFAAYQFYTPLVEPYLDSLAFLKIS